MNFYEQEKIQEMKQKKFDEQHGVCAGCETSFRIGEPRELAHLIPQRRWTIEKYGKEIIHHELNMKLTHPGICNSHVQLNVNATPLIESHADKIRNAIIDE